MMIAASAPRRLYARSGSVVLLYGGLYFGPKGNAATELTADDEVTVKVLKKAGGVERVQVTQVVSGNAKAITETWTKKVLVFKKRGEAKSA